MRRVAAVTGCSLLLAGIVTGARYALYADVVQRTSALVDDVPGYGDELRRLPPYGEVAPDHVYSGPGWYPRRSPNGKRVAVTVSAAIPAFPFGLVTDRPFLHTVAVWSPAAQRLQPVVSIMESDPHSGIAHRYAWSRDSRALLIHGSGRLPENYDEVLELCLVYLPGRDALYRLGNCPPLWQRNTAPDGAAEQ